MRLRLREVREGQFVTQEELAEKVGMSRTTISRLESGLQVPRISTVRRIALALGVSPSELIDRSDDDAKAAA